MEIRPGSIFFERSRVRVPRASRNRARLFQIHRWFHTQVVEGVVRAPNQPSPKHAWNGYAENRFTSEQGAVGLAVLFGLYVFTTFGVRGYFFGPLFLLWVAQVPARIAADAYNRRHADGGRRPLGPILL